MTLRRALPFALLLAALPFAPAAAQFGGMPGMPGSPGMPGAPGAPGGGFGAAPQQQGPPPACQALLANRDETQKHAMAIRDAGKKKVGPEEACKLFKVFLASETKMIKGLEEHAATCGVPPDIIKAMKTQHAQAAKTGKHVCDAAAAQGPAPRRPEPERRARHHPDGPGCRGGQEGRRHLRHPHGHAPAAMTDGAGRVADSTGNWVDGLAPEWSRPYLRLARLDRPIGSWLLLLPCWWSAGLAAVAARQQVDLWLLVLFFIGAFAMRGAGCTWNDIVDRDLDKRVERTRSRPIPSGQVSVRAAAAFLVLQALVGLAVLLQLDRFAIAVGFASLAIVAVYPFMKRFTYWPQIGLGLAFSWGALMGWAATFWRLDPPAYLLYAGAIAWVIGYDTIYAHQDREDDALIGVKSTAILFGARTKPMLTVCYALAVVLIALAGWLAGGGVLFTLGLVAFAAHLAWQIVRLDIDDPLNCLAVFKSNRDAGLILFAALVLDAAWHAL